MESCAVGNFLVALSSGQPEKEVQTLCQGRSGAATSPLQRQETDAA